MSQETLKQRIDALQTQAMLLIDSEPAKSVEMYEEAENLVRRHFKTHDMILAGLLNDKGMAYFKTGDYRGSIKSLKEALHLKMKIGDGYLIGKTLANLGVVYRANCQYEDSIKTLDKVRIWAKDNNRKDMFEKMEIELANTTHAKEKKPLVQFADIRIGDEQGFTKGIGDLEYLPLAFSDIFIKIDELSIVFEDLQHAYIEIGFSLSGKETDFYRKQEWKKARIELLHSSLENLTPNFLVFYGKENQSPVTEVRLTDSHGNSIEFDSEEQCWTILNPDSYPIGGFTSPMPVCEKFMFFNGLGKLVYWNLKYAKYHMRINLQTNTENSSLEFGLFFPFKNIIIDASNLRVKTEHGVSIRKGYLKRIPYSQSKEPKLSANKTLGFNHFKYIYPFKIGMEGKLENVEPAQKLEITDFEVLAFEFLPILEQVKSKFDIFPFLKEDVVFRKEVGLQAYNELLNEARKIPEKCQQHTTGEQCRECSAKMLNLCIINVIGVLCGSTVLPHHGFEYSDLLVKVQNTEKNQPISYPLIIKGPNNLTWGSDGGLLRQTLERLQDLKVKTIIIVHTGQMDNHLKINLEYQADLQGKSLVFIDDKDLSQFLTIFNEIRK